MSDFWESLPGHRQLAALARWMLPPRRQRAVPWTGIELVAAVLVHFIWVAVFYEVLRAGPADWLYGPGTIAATRAEDDESHKKAEDDESRKKLARSRLNLTATALAFPFEVATVLLMFAGLSGTWPYQLGLTAHRWKRNVALGALGWLVLAPLVEAVFLLAQWVQSLLTAKGMEEHPFTQLVKEFDLTGGELGLIFFLALVVAPVTEELFFRGMLQPWLTRRRWGGHLAMVLSLLAALASRFNAISGLMHGDGSPGWAGYLTAFAPALFVLLLLPVYLWVYRVRQAPRGAAVFGTALFFGAVHSFAWPSPVALFVLALGLGWLAQRTQSLVGPIVLHSLFNGIACVQLLLIRV